MAKRKATGTRLTIVEGQPEPKEIIHLSTQVVSSFGYVVDGNVVPLPPISFTINRIDAAAMAEFLATFEAQREKLSAQVNGEPDGDSEA